MSSGGRGVPGWFARVAAVCVVALVTTLVTVPGAAAEEGAIDPQAAPSLWCASESSFTATEGERYAVAWVPAGATVTFTAADIEILPSKYFIAGRGEYTYTTTFGYDAAGQLVSADRRTGPDERYVYDRLGRRSSSTVGAVSTTYEWDAASQLLRRTVGGVVHDYGYDASGRRTGESWDGGAAALAWVWDARGALVEERRTGADGVTASARVVRGDGRLDRVDTAVDGAVVDRAGIVWDETLAIPQPIWSGEPGQEGATRAVYGPDLLRVDCASGAGCSGAIAHDAHGSALQTPETAGIVRAPAYGLWGQDAAAAAGAAGAAAAAAASGGGRPPAAGPPGQRAPISAGPAYGFGGELHVGSLVHLRAREYDPATGTFLSPDPLAGVVGTSTVANPYHYADNDPVNRSDPTGLRPGESECAAALVRVVCEQRQAILIGAVSFAAGLVCGVVAAPAGPFVAGAVGAVCGGAVHRALTAHFEGGNPWAAALDPEAMVTDVVVGAVTLGIGARLVTLARPLTARVTSQFAARAPPVAAARGGGQAGSGGAAAPAHDTSAANASSELDQGFATFRAAQRSLPSPGPGNVYDHVVERSQIGTSRSGFDPRLIHNPANLNAVPAALNQAKANYYSSIRPYTGGRTVRDWLNGQSFEQQYSFGMEITELIRTGGPLP